MVMVVTMENRGLGIGDGEEGIRVLSGREEGF